MTSPLQEYQKPPKQPIQDCIALFLMLFFVFVVIAALLLAGCNGDGIQIGEDVQVNNPAKKNPIDGVLDDSDVNNNNWLITEGPPPPAPPWPVTKPILQPRYEGVVQYICSDQKCKCCYWRAIPNTPVPVMETCPMCGEKAYLRPYHAVYPEPKGVWGKLENGGWMVAPHGPIDRDYPYPAPNTQAPVYQIPRPQQSTPYRQDRET